MIETVKVHCQHEDCKYRGRFNFVPCCVYMLVTGRPRGCDISKCDKYVAGKLKIGNGVDGFRYIDD